MGIAGKNGMVKGGRSTEAVYMSLVLKPDTWKTANLLRKQRRMNIQAAVFTGPKDPRRDEETE